MTLIVAGARWMLAWFVVLVLCPVRYYSASTGLDPSWAVTLNQFQADGVLFGRDVLLTYGPLAYLIFPMPYGTNLQQGIAFQVLLWVAFGATVFFLVARGRAGLTNLAIAAVCVPPGVRLIHEFGYAGPDFFLEFLVIFWLACAVQVGKYFYYLACAGALLLIKIKVTTATGALAAILLLPILLAAIRDPNAIRFALASWIGVPVVFALVFRVYSGSWTAVARYVRSALDYSSGGGTTLSLAGPMTPVYAGLAILCGFGILTAAFWWRGEKRLAVFAAALAGPLFLEFKHSFLRQDSHEAILFTFAPLMLLAVLWFVRFEWRVRFSGPALAALAGVALIIVPCVRILGVANYAGSPLFPTTVLRDLASFGDLKQRLIAASEAGLAADRLPADLLARLNGRTVAIYPWESAYAAANTLRHRPMPTFQAYLAYTPYLDGVNAEFFSTESRPDTILFDWAAIDDRHPLLDCPQTFLAMYANYELEGRFGPHLLLHRRSQPLTGPQKQIKQQSVRWGESFQSADTGRVVLAHMPARLTLAGKAWNFLFRTAPMYLTLSGPGGYVLGFRVPPAVLDAPFPLNIVPMDLDDAANLFAGKPMRERFDTAVLSGPARGAFQAPLAATMWDSGLPLPPPGSEPRPTLAGLPAAPAKIERVTLDRLNGLGVSEVSSRETVPVSGELGFVSVEGWAVLASPESTILVEVDGKLFRTALRPTGTLGTLFPPNTAVRSFESKVPTGALGPETHTIRVVEMLPQGAPPRVGERTLSFRIDPR